MLPTQLIPLPPAGPVLLLSKLFPPLIRVVLLKMGSVTTTQSRFVAGESIIDLETGYSFAGTDDWALKQCPAGPSLLAIPSQ